jgi:hypothetical protein
MNVPQRLTEEWVTNMNLGIPFLQKYKWAKGLSIDDLLNFLYFTLNLVVIILATVITIKNTQQNLSNEEERRIVLSQKILRLLAGVLILGIGCFNLFYIHYKRKIKYVASNRFLLGLTQITLGIVFIVLTSFMLANEDD